jgi:Cd2+/Zn2+-exporting ATPase
MSKTLASGKMKIKELDCPTEQSRIASVLETIPGIDTTKYDLKLGEIEITFEPNLTTIDFIKEQIVQGCGYSCRVILPLGDVKQDQETDQKSTNKLIGFLNNRQLLVVMAGIALLSGLFFWLIGVQSAERVCYASSIVFSLGWIAPRVFLSVKSRRMDIFGLVGLAIMGAILLGLWDEAATVGVLFGISELLEAFAARRAKVSIDSLMELQPDQAELLQKDGSVIAVDPSQLQLSDLVRVRPGQKIPIDGVIRTGETHIDQKVITGESMPVEAQIGSNVFAGTLNSEGMIQVEVTRVLGDSIVSQIARKVSQAQVRRAPIERVVDQFARLYTPMIVLIAGIIITFPPIYNLLMNQPTAWPDWLFRGLVLLVIACPCALVISTPVAVVCALANAAKHGILVREGFVIEQFSQLQTIAFDKTGTLTKGQPQVQQILNFNQKLNDQEIIGLAAALGQEGSHVVSRALVRHATENGIAIPKANDVQEIPGQGTTGEVNGQLLYLGSHRFIDGQQTCSREAHEQIAKAEQEPGTGVMLASGGNVIAWIRLMDEPREEAANLVSELDRMHIATIMLTGDNQNTARMVAAELGIENYHAAMLPQEKLEFIENLVKNEKKMIGMVGDGVNDAPSLVAATVGISMGEIASAITSQAADVVLINNHLSSISRLVYLSRATNFIIRSNIVLAIVSKIVVMLLAIMGEANFLLAMLSDVGVSLVVIANSLRILKFEIKSK